MRYIAIAAIVVLLLVFFGPIVMAAGRNIAQQAKTAWKKR